MSQTVKKNTAVKTRRQPIFRKVNAKTRPSMNDVQEDALRRFANVVLNVVKSRFSKTAFTRDDILVSISDLRLDDDGDWAKDAAGINDTTTGTRYHKVCLAVQFLMQNQQLVNISWLQLCLPESRNLILQQELAKTEYLPTARRIIQDHYPTGTIVDIMSVVRLWQSDQHLPENIKRMIIRSIFPHLLKEKTLKKGAHRAEFVVR